LQYFRGAVANPSDEMNIDDCCHFLSCKRYEPDVMILIGVSDLNKVFAIDMHVHPATEEAKKSGGPYLEFAKKYFGQENKVIPIDVTAEMYREHNMMAVLLAKDARSNTGLPPVSNNHVAECVRKHPDVFFGFGSVDPYSGLDGKQEVYRCVQELGLRGLKFQQAVQGFYPNNERVYPIYEAAQELGIPVLFHMGTTGIGAGAPGGMGLRLKYCQPIYIDDVAADFPELKIIGAHPGWPWTDELLAIAVHKANVYIDLSGWAPKYFPSSLVHYAKTILKDKMLFGTDWPLITVERWMEEFNQYGFLEETKRKIFLDNALKVLKIQDIETS
jgi:predicted TIM-barrel fold metal-dependent hydrolase